MITKVEIILILVLAILIGGGLYSIGSDAAECTRRGGVFVHSMQGYECVQRVLP
jgi:hypothetical protein